MKLFDRIASVITRIADIGGYIAGWLVFLMMLLVAYETFMRYVLHRPPMVADEFGGYMLVAVAYLGTAYTWKEKGHIRITSVLEKVSTRVANWLRLIALVSAFVFSVALSLVSYRYLLVSFELKMASATWLHTPLQGPQMTLVIGFILLSLQLIVEIARAIVDIRSGKAVEGGTQ
jgi:TRAP-type C4-dicarboxylate transport system permease small subunit